jgi:thiaminase/transcriptional activator TenA
VPVLGRDGVRVTGAGTAAGLWRGNAAVAAACRAHPFVAALGDGTLPQERFAAYLAQDAFFLEAFARAYAWGVARSPDAAGVHAFGRLLGGVLAELRLHAGYAAELGIDLAAVEPLPATLAYTDFLLATAATGSTAELCAAMTPCMRLYAHLGQGLLPALVDGHPYGAWIQAYAGAEFEELARELEALLDRYVRVDTRGPAAAAYARAMGLELAFFDAALPDGEDGRG